MCYYCSAYWNMFNIEQDSSFDFKQFFSPLTKSKAILIIVILGFFVYFNSLFNGFVWDDNDFIIKNPEVHQLNIVKLLSPNMFNSGPFYRPIPAIYFATLYTLFGKQPFFYHVIQITLHFIDTSLLYIYLSFFFSGGLSLFLAILFLVHPINGESVVYIGSTQSELYFLFGILALIIGHKQNLSRSKVLMVTGLLFLCSMVKETGFLFILLVIAYRFIFKLKKRKEVLISGILIGVIYACIRVFVGGVKYKMNRIIPIAGLTLSQRLLHIPAIMLYYLKTFGFPLQLGVWQQWTFQTTTFENFFFPLIICLIFFLLLFYAAFFLYKHDRKQFRVFIFFTLWFLSGMGMLLQIVPLDMTVADRWMYFPIVGLLGMLGVGIHTLQLKSSRVKSALIVAAVILIGILSLRTIVRNTNWSDEITLYSHDIQVDDDYFKEAMLARDLRDAGMMDQAVPHYEKSLEFNPYSKIKICHSGQTEKQSNYTCMTMKDAVWQNLGIDE